MPPSGLYLPQPLPRESRHDVYLPLPAEAGVMIDTAEVHELSHELGVPLHHVQKDYVMGWLLWGISGQTYLDQSLILKGGSCLRKLYFADTRFSDDLDFTTREEATEGDFRAAILDVLRRLVDVADIPFDLDRTRVDSKRTPDPDATALDARVYFAGFAGDSSLTFRIKFDVSPYERIVLPIQRHPIIHNFSDASSCSGTVFGYSLEEILAEKLRCWIQRTRPRDLFDAAKIIGSGVLPISKRNILAAFAQKTLFKDIPPRWKGGAFGGPEVRRRRGILAGDDRLFAGHADCRAERDSTLQRLRISPVRA